MSTGNMKSLRVFAVAGLILTVVVPAQATSISTFAFAPADYNMSGFSSGGPPIGFPTAGPDTLLIDTVTGMYNLDIPPAGGMYDVYASGFLAFDFDGDGGPDLDIQFMNEYLGNYPSPGPSTSWGPGVIQNTQVTLDGINFYTLDVGFDVSLGSSATYPSGTFGGDAYATFTFSGQDIVAFNTALTALDNALGGGDGIIDGQMMGYIEITAIPEPLTMFGVFMGLGGLAGYIRKRNIPGVREMA